MAFENRTVALHISPSRGLLCLANPEDAPLGHPAGLYGFHRTAREYSKECKLYPSRGERVSARCGGTSQCRVRNDDLRGNMVSTRYTVVRDGVADSRLELLPKHPRSE